MGCCYLIFCNGLLLEPWIRVGLCGPGGSRPARTASSPSALFLPLYCAGRQVYRTEYGRGHEAFFANRTAEYWRSFAPAAVDNYVVRA
jgi:hypothetical protein